jgi:ribose transport system permease protein
VTAGPAQSGTWWARAAPLVFALAALALVVGFGCVFSGEGAFTRAYTHSSTLGQIAAFMVMACGMTLVILTGGIDLSVGSVVALCGVVAAHLARDRDWPAAAAIAAGIGAGAGCGLISGALIALLRLQPFIATLAMMAFARGLAKWSTTDTKIVMLDLPRGWGLLELQAPGPWGFGIPVVVFLAVLCVLGTLILLRMTPMGLAIYAIGDNEEAARYAGMRVKWTKVIVYAVCGALAGLAGVIVAAREHQGNPDGGIGYELTAIAMVVVGGTSLSGGRGGVILTVLGALTIGYLQKILDINGFSTDQQLMITGGIIALAVLVQGLRRR